MSGRYIFKVVSPNDNDSESIYNSIPKVLARVKDIKKSGGQRYEGTFIRFIDTRDFRLADNGKQRIADFMDITRKDKNGIKRFKPLDEVEKNIIDKLKRNYENPANYMDYDL